MAKTEANPEELEVFANLLQITSDAIWNEARGLQVHYERLRDHWRDRKFERFNQIFQEMMLHLDSFRQHSHAYTRHLRIRADILRKYLGPRY